MVRARIEAWDENESGARATFGQVRVETAGGQIRATGPKDWMQQRWSVSYEIFVPQRTDLTLETTNGGIGIAAFAAPLLPRPPMADSASPGWPAA